MNAAKIIGELKNKLASEVGAILDVKFAFPFLQLCLTHPQFIGLSEDEREAYIAKKLELDIPTLRSIGNAALMHYHWIAPGESTWIPEKGDHWLYRESWPNPIAPTEMEKPFVVHFFGYKGGQARSTVLAVLARSLAENGKKVLLVDADLEAPSLPMIVGKQPRLAASTLLGLYLKKEITPKPISCVLSASGGMVDMLAARLPEENDDIEYDAFTLKALLDPAVPMELGERILNHAKISEYDVVFIDQRTGSSPATLNWFDAIPGGVCIFARLDHQWNSGARFYRVLIERSPSLAAALVSFKPDEENPETYRSRTADQVATLSRIFESAFLAKLPDSDESDDIDPAEGIADRDRWVMWPYDQAFRVSRFPSSLDLGHLSRFAISQITSLLGLDTLEKRRHLPSQTSLLSPSHSSGYKDSEVMIHTPVLRDLRAENSAVNYVFGRKGTGKSRLFQALVDDNRGIALVADTEFDGSGLRSTDIKEILRIFTPCAPENLWWRLLTLASQGETDRRKLDTSIRADINGNIEGLRAAVTRSSTRKTFLIDGLETAFRAEHVQLYVNALFEVMRTIQGDSDIREKVDVRLFLRTDLKEKASAQNIEQQLDGRDRYLSWDLQGILNFMLSRVISPAYPIFKTNFPVCVENIEHRQGDIIRAEVSEDDAFQLLLPMFPERVRRVNAHMQTFISLHFSDSSGEGGRYYPRFVLDFLSSINKAGQAGQADNTFRGAIIEEGRLSSAVVQHAFDEAAKQFMSAVRLELESVVKLEPDQLQKVLDAFTGMATPFDRDSLIFLLGERTGIAIDQIADALNTFKSVGLFEDRPGFAGKEWRAGRIFRSALKMKLRRSPPIEI